MMLGCLFSLQASCGYTQSQDNVLDQNDVVLVDSIGTNRIAFHRNTTSVDSLRSLIINRIKLAVDSIGRVIQVKDVEFRVVVFPEPTMPRSGLSGVAPDEHFIYLLLDPDNPHLAEGIAGELVPTIAHEFHHTLRHRTVGYGSTLFESLVSEGLAEQFTMEVIGEPPPWMGPIPDADLDYWQAKAEKVWFDPEYDPMPWFTGRDGIPRGTGHELGARIVGAYLTAHPGERASTLYDAEAERFLLKRKE